MINKLIAKIFGHYALKNLRADFDIMAERMKLNADTETANLLFVWFVMGHINSADKESKFNKHYYGDQTTGGPH